MTPCWIEPEINQATPSETTTAKTAAEPQKYRHQRLCAGRILLRLGHLPLELVENCLGSRKECLIKRLEADAVLVGREMQGQLMIARVAGGQGTVHQNIVPCSRSLVEGIGVGEHSFVGCRRADGRDVVMNEVEQPVDVFSEGGHLGRVRRADVKQKLLPDLKAQRFDVVGRGHFGAQGGYLRVDLAQLGQSEYAAGGSYQRQCNYDSE